MKRLLFLVAIAVLGANLACIGQTNPANTPIFNQDDSVLNEVSGIAQSRAHADIFWMNNDSGDTARVFAVNRSGKIALTVNLEGVEATDWEDIDAQGEWIYVADCGDNFAVRSDIAIYRFKEPTFDATKTGQNVVLKRGEFEKMTLEFPDGARDCESLAATPDGRLLLVSKNDSGSNFYVLNSPFQNSTTKVLKKIGSFVFGATGKFTKLATGADFSSQGRKLVVTTYTGLYEFPLTSPFSFDSLRFAPITCDIPPQRQCEAVCYSVDGKTIFSTGEGKKQPVFEIASQLP